MSHPVLIVAGPTASGKSSLALDAADMFHGAVINADSMQVYRELRVLTARPSPADEARVPHRLYGVISAAERCSVGQWLPMASAAIAQARAAGRLPIVVGGTGLYLKALTDGLAAIPTVPDSAFADAVARHDRLGGRQFRDELARIDPRAALRIAPSDRQRLLRAFAVARATGRPLSEWQRDAPSIRAAPDAHFLVLVLLPERHGLYAALDARFERMLAGGGLDEARTLLDLGLDPELPAMKAVGVRELTEHVRGAISLAEASKAAKQATRRFAKRQITWLRHQVRAHAVFNEQYSERMRAEIFAFIRMRLLTRDA
jgi:tRNA dimethylallyltransferase